MAELEHAPAAATETADRVPAGEQRPGGGDSHGSYPRAASAADTDPGYYDGDVQAALAADTAPTRQQAARDATAAHAQQTGDETVPASHDASASGRDADIEAILHENDRLPDPRTRQQAARDSAIHRQTETASATPHDAPASEHDAGIDAILHENDNLPDPRTRHQAARDAAAQTGPATQNEAPAAIGDQQPRHGYDPLAETAGTDRPAVTVLAQGGHDAPFSAMRATVEMRTLGDDTPTGIGLKPGGDQLRKMEPKAESWREAFRNEIRKESDEITDAAEKWGDLGARLFERPPASSHTEIPAGQPDQHHHEPQGIEGGQLAVAAFALGLLGAEAARKTHGTIRKWKEKQS